MNPFLKIKQFASREDGSLLVFFLISVVTILGIVALSFDLGRRASTQTDMQSFADNVALAAAGELDGQADAIARATWAANNAIAAANEALKGGVAGTTATLSIESLTFYSSLPDRDRPASFAVADLSDPTDASYKYSLPTTNTTTDDALATYVGVRLNRVDPQWIFGKVFEGGNDIDNLDPGATPANADATDNRRSIGAVAIAGNSGYTCRVAPLMFCLPRDSSGNPEELTPGIGVQLQTVGNGAAWNPGQFGYLDVGSIPDAVAGTCAGETPESRFQACLLAQGISACFQDRGVDIQTGQRGGQEPSGFNLPFGIFGQAMQNLRSDPIYATGPHTISGVVSGNGNSNGNGGGPNNCRAGSDSPDTMAFPMDTCHPNCVTASGAATRFGDGVWDRDLYVDTNYTFTKPNGTEVPGSFFDFPNIPLTRYQYYLLEIERARNGGVMTGFPNHPAFAGLTANWSDPKYQAETNPGTGSVNSYNSWDDYWDDITTGFNPIIPDTHGRQDNGLPQCNQVSPSANADRRVVVVAGIDCPPGLLNGDEDDVPVVQYYEVFLLAPARDSVNDAEGPNGNTNNSAPQFELFVEVIRPVGGEAGGSTVDAGTFREVIQLYK